ncbi:MAG: PAS domain-containing protein, partial [Rubrobacter sp.]|nr:PAS domain-containing protein [Rubrobacter sp.]
SLPVRTVTEQEHLVAGVVFVVPADRDVNITDSEIELSTSSNQGPKPSVDRLLSSAAEAYGEHLIAVILTGTGSDGAEGAHIVRKMGGTVVIQNPDTAEFPSMPLSLAPNTVDIVAELDRIGPILKNLLTGAEAVEKREQEGAEQQALQEILEQLRERYGMDFGSYKTPTIRRRLQRRIATTDADNIEGYARYLDEHPEEYHQLIGSFLIKVTEFFRDPEVFTYLKEEILPRLVNEAQEEHRQLRIWSAGCATGEEAYSLAILVSEVLDSQEAELFNARIFATDMDEEAVNFARRGLYPASALSNLSEEQANKYFIRKNEGYEIKKSVRNKIVFGEHDLAQRSPFPRIDLVVSRNVLIYFAPELQRRALQVFAYSLRNGGYLVLGRAETTSPLGESFVLEHPYHKIYQRQGPRFLMPLTAPVNFAPVLKRLERVRSSANLQSPSGSQRRVRSANAVNEGSLSQLPIGVVAVDRRYHIQSINPVARDILSIRSTAIGEDFLHLMREEVPYAEIRRGIDAAFNERRPTSTDEFVIEEITTGKPRYIQLVCHPEQAEDEERAHAVTIVVNEVTEPTLRRHELEKQLDKAQGDAAYQKAQNERLIETNRLLEQANRDLTRINEELYRAYEESLITTEEAQAATEEVETLNEELQATNEELETVNEELQATIEELNTTNDDLQARSLELQELAQTSEDEQRMSDVRTEELAEQLRRSEKSRLEAVLSCTNDAVLAVNPEGEMLFSNDAYKEAFGEAPRLAGALLEGFTFLNENGEKLPPEATPQARAAKGESFEMRFTIDEKSGVRRHFDVKGRPIEGREEIGGGVIVIREITEN